MALRPLTNEERKQMRHALGLDQAAKPYRNSFVSYGRDTLWEGLCGIGAANRNSFDAADKWVYRLTEEGIEAVIHDQE